VSRPVVLIGGQDAEAAMRLFTSEGVDARMVATAAELREADKQGVRYTLVHVGVDDGEAEGTYARAHHRKARARKALSSPLDSVEGIGPARKRLLMRTFGSLDAIREAPVADIVRLGIPERVAVRLKELV